MKKKKKNKTKTKTITAGAMFPIKRVNLVRTLRFGCKGIQVRMHTFIVGCLAV